MSITKELLEIICCPATHQSLRVAPAEVVEDLNKQIQKGSAQSVAGNLVSESIEGGFIREDGAVLYPVRENIPILMIDEAIRLR